jgi:hypothetical protein
MICAERGGHGRGLGSGPQASEGFCCVTARCGAAAARGRPSIISGLSARRFDDAFTGRPRRDSLMV